MKKVVIYDTHYGTSKAYASWIAESLNCDLFRSSATKTVDFDSYDLIICGGGLYAGKILCSSVFNKYDLTAKKRILFTVGLSDPTIKENTDSIKKNIDKFLTDTSNLKVFHFRGGIDYKKLNMIHKLMMKMLSKMIRKKPDSELTAENKEFLETYNSQADFCDKNSIKPLLDYVDAL